MQQARRSILIARPRRGLGSCLSNAVASVREIDGRWLSYVLAACVLHVLLVAGCGGDDPTKTLTRGHEQVAHETASPAEEAPHANSLAQTQPQDPLAEAEATFQGRYSRAEITARVGHTIDAYNVLRTDDNYAQSVATLSALRKRLGVPEMDILEYMTRSLPEGATDFSEAALQAAIQLTTERRPLGSHG